ncbi:MAG: hypothetical protein JWM96_841 [Alphaproteobacteria bacterium]|nr:hypothetical protein [Alphaproteobacteria bacterium]
MRISCVSLSLISNKSMTHTHSLLALCPSDVFYNDLDKRALALCLEMNKNIRRFKGNPCVPEETRMTLEAHVYDLVDMFAQLPQTHNILQKGDKESEEYRFVIDTFRVLLRHDLGESIFEPQTYLQKVDPNLPKIDGGDFEAGVAKAIYHLAQHAAATGEETAFRTRITALQNDYAHFDVEASGRRGQDYADYMYANFAAAITSLNQFNAALPAISDAAMADLILLNDARHFADFQLVEDPKIQAGSPAGIFAKIIDTAQLEDIFYALEKVKYPDLPYFPLEFRPHDYILMLCKRSEKLLPKFYRMVQKKEFLFPFLQAAYEMVYRRVASGTLLLRPYLCLTDALENEPGLAADAAQHAAFDAVMLQKIQQRRKTIHPLDDTMILSGLEVAAKALLYRNQLIPVRKSMIEDACTDPGHRVLFDEILADLQQDKGIADKIAQVMKICAGRVPFYQEVAIVTSTPLAA